MHVSARYPVNMVGVLPPDPRQRQSPAASPAQKAAAEDTLQLSAAAGSLQRLAMQPDALERGRAIMAGHDLHSMRYSQLVALAGELRDAGLLAADNYLDFIGPNPELATINSEGAPASAGEGQQDFLGRHEQQLAFMKQIGAEPRHVAFQQNLVTMFRLFHELQTA